MALKGGLVNDLGIGMAGKKVTVDDAVEFSGSLVTAKNTGNYGLTGDGGDPQGLMLDSSVDPVTNWRPESTPVFLTGQAIAKFPMLTGTRWAIPLVSDNAAISIGDRIVTAGAGCVDKYAGSGAAWQVGIAMEAININSGTFVIVEIDKRYISA